MEQHERMLQERERERREGARSAGLMSRQPTRTDIRYQGETEEIGVVVKWESNGEWDWEWDWESEWEWK